MGDEETAAQQPPPEAPDQEAQETAAPDAQEDTGEFKPEDDQGSGPIYKP
jgi:hypothetical protein